MIRQVGQHARSRRVVGILIAWLLLAETGPTPSWGAPKPSEPLSVGMIALLATPEKYNGKVIRTWGFLNLNLQPEDDALFLHEEDSKIPLLKNSFKLDLTEKQEAEFRSLNQTYVMVDGTLNSVGPAGNALESGTLVHITLVHGWKPYVPFEPNEK